MILSLINNRVIAQKCSKFIFHNILVSYSRVSPQTCDKTLRECYQTLNLPPHSKQHDVRKAFLELAKKYHPDSGSPEACINKFCTIENAFRVLSKHNADNNSADELGNTVFDIKHTAPQHRQYLSFEGLGSGTPSQRMKQWTQARAQKAAINVMEHKMAKAVAAENTIMKKDDALTRKHDIKTKYGFDRLVEDLIQESISKGEFDNLSGQGKPLRDQTRNPYVDFTTHKLNEVLLNNGFTPQWITMNGDINADIEALKKNIRLQRSNLGPYPLTDDDDTRWQKIYNDNKNTARSINAKINTFNLIVPLMDKQKFHIQFEKICEEILQKGEFTHNIPQDITNTNKECVVKLPNTGDDVLMLCFKALVDLFSGLTKSFSTNNKKENS